MKYGLKRVVFSLAVCLTLMGNSATCYAWPYKIAPLPAKINDDFNHRLICGVTGITFLLKAHDYSSAFQSNLLSYTYSQGCAIVPAYAGMHLLVRSIFQTDFLDMVNSCFKSAEDIKLRNISFSEEDKWDRAFITYHPDPTLRKIHKKRRSLVLNFVADQVTDGELEALEDILHFVNSSDDELDILCKYKKNEHSPRTTKH